MDHTVTFDFRVSPEQLFTLVAGSSSKARMAGTLTTDLWKSPASVSFLNWRTQSSLCVTQQNENMDMDTDLVAGRPVRVLGVAVAALTPEAACHIPGVGCTAVAILTGHVGQAGTLTAAAVAVTISRRGAAGRAGAQLVTHTFCEAKQQLL